MFADTLILTKKLDTSAKHPLSPMVLRKFNEEYRTTFELNLGAVTNYMATFHPLLDPRGQSRKVTRKNLQHLHRFEVLVEPPEGDDRMASVKVIHRPWGQDEFESDHAKRKIYLYCRVITAETLGYGKTFTAIDKSNLPIRDDSPARTVSHLLSRAFSVKSIDDQFVIWHSMHHQRMHRKIPKLRKGKNLHPDNFRGTTMMLTRGFVDRNAKLLATIDCGVGYVHFLLNSPDAEVSPGQIVHVSVTDENGSPKLADTFPGMDGAITGIFASDEFKAGLVDFFSR